MAAAITYSNLFSAAWNNIYALLNSSTNVVDPTLGSAEYRKWIYTRDPDVKSPGFAGFPFLIIHPVTVNADAGMRSLNRNARMVRWLCEVEVVTGDREYGDRDGQGMIDNDAIAEDVVQTLNDLANRNTLSANNLYNVAVDASDISVDEFNNTLIYRRTLLVTFECRMKVSA